MSISPRISSGEVIWCQGFSEPDSGSDLASLKHGRPQGGRILRITGQKIWTSYATMAAVVFSARQDVTWRKEATGFELSFWSRCPLLASRYARFPPMIGPHHLNEVFFDDVIVLMCSKRARRCRRRLEDRAGGPLIRAGRNRGYARCERLLDWAPACGSRWGRDE